MVLFSERTFELAVTISHFANGVFFLLAPSVGAAFFAKAGYTVTPRLGRFSRHNSKDLFVFSVFFFFFFFFFSSVSFSSIAALLLLLNRELL